MSATVSAQDRGLLFGDGVFDTLAVHDGVALWLEAHVNRLVRHANSIGMVGNAHLIHAAILNCMTQFSQPDCIIRTTLTRGVTDRGLWPTTNTLPTLVCHATKLDRAVFGTPASLMVSSIARNETSPTSRIKSLNYLDHVLATREAHVAAVDDALFLNSRGQLACCTIGNVFILEGDQLLTPPQKDGALDGIIRAVLLDHPPQGLRSIEASITLDRALKADSMLITNSVRLVRNVTQLNERIFTEAASSRTVLSHLNRLIHAQKPNGLPHHSDF
jgi:branched-chain amino acid aminotransferase